MSINDTEVNADHMTSRARQMLFGEKFNKFLLDPEHSVEVVKFENEQRNKSISRRSKSLSEVCFEELDC